jgi:histidinol-phosphatase (PHP family)
MIANFHTHTPRCRHASGTEEEYVRCALKAGLQTLGFSDHAPYPFPNGYYSTFRMFPDELPGYVAAVEDVRRRYAGQIQIHLGVEAEYYPKYFKDMVSMVKDQGIEYMLLGQHMLYDEMEGIGTAGPSADPVLLRQYCDQTIEAMQTGLFTYFAHPDLVNFVGDEKFYRAESRRLCRAARECGIPLEINLLGIREGRHYPNPTFWECAAEENCPVILGIDAHQPHNFQHATSEAQMLAMIQKLGLHKLDTVSLRILK